MNDQSTRTDVPDFIGSLRAGVFENKIAAALSEVALGVVTHGKQGKVTLTFDIKQVAESRTVNVQHKIAYTVPTKNGKQQMEDATDTPMHVGRGGKMMLFPEEQESFQFSKEKI